MRNKRSYPLIRMILILVLVALAAFAIPIALAQATTDPPATFSALLQQVLLPAVLTLAGAAVTLLTAMASKWLTAAAAGQKNELIRRILELVATTATTAVAHVAQTAVSELKAAAADGKLTRAEAQAALDAAVAQVWAAIGQAARDALTQAAGGSTQAAIKTYITPAVEEQVAILSNILPAAKPITDEAARRKALELGRSRLGIA